LLGVISCYAPITQGALGFSSFPLLLTPPHRHTAHHGTVSRRTGRGPKCLLADASLQPTLLGIRVRQSDMEAAVSPTLHAHHTVTSAEPLGSLDNSDDSSRSFRRAPVIYGRLGESPQHAFDVPTALLDGGEVSSVGMQAWECALTPRHLLVPRRIRYGGSHIG
jgi:hypothetical protein